MQKMVLVDKKQFVMADADSLVPPEGEVVIGVRRCGICGSDVHAYHGEHPFISFPVVLGHEFSGVVAKLGPGVSGLSEGQPVTVEPLLTCGECINCRSGRYNVCLNRRIHGAQAPGAYADEIAVAADKVVPMPSGVSFEDGALVEPISVGIHAAERAQIAAGSKVVVLGCGPIGLFVAQAAKALSQADVLAIDVEPSRVEIAQRNGLSAVDASGRTLVDVIQEHFGDDRFDVALECTGRSAGLDDLIGAARNGTRIVLVSILPSPQEMKNLTMVAEYELDLIGTSVYTKKDFGTTLELLASKAITCHGVVSHTFPLAEAAAAFDLIDSKQEQFFKVMLAIGD